MKRRLWVVEIWSVYDYQTTEPRWAPTAGVRFTRKAGLSILDTWRTLNPSDKFRLRQYTPKEEE